MADDRCRRSAGADAKLAGFGEAADRASLGLIRFDHRSRVRFANRSAHEILGRRSGSLVGRSAIEALVDHRLEALVRAATAGRAGSHESQTTEGTSITVRAGPAEDGGTWVTLENTTELARLRRIRSEFIDNLSHELRTPLTNVRLLTELLIDDLADADVPKRVTDRVATLDIETGHLVQMVNELLDLSRMEHVATTIRQDEVSLVALIEEAQERLRTFADRQGITFDSRVASDLPAVRGDAERLAQLLMNLLHNAVKFSPDGGVVGISAHEREGSVVVTITDEGPGIPAAAQERVFERFYKVDRARQRGLGGTGLGLAIARHVTELHGGRIWLESTEGAGSTFSFSIPVA